jgi:tocopherol cyclase
MKKKVIMAYHLIDFPHFSKKTGMRHYIRRWRALWNPDMYHGWGKTRRYFEGWYFKIVDPAEDYAFAVIPGISMKEDGQRHAFIQVLDGKRCTATYHEFPAEQFLPSDRVFELQLGENFFSTQGIRLNLPELKGSLRIKGVVPWPKMLGAPGIMGWYSFVPFMECYHGVVSLDHHLDGHLEVYGKPVDFTGGQGYIEKDWGESFPSSWIWTQTNHFDAGHQVSLMASVARIPWIGSHFIGYIVGFLFDGILYRFATYTGAMMKASLGVETVSLAFRDSRNLLEITCRKGETGVLVSPISGQMTGKVNESMQATVEVKFYENDRLVFSGVGRNAGLEVAGPVGELLTETWRR